MKSRLAELKIELTQECPLACLHCSTSSSRKQTSSLPRDVVLRLLREGAALGVRKVVFTGGEPLLSPYLSEAIETAANLGLLPRLYTSGIFDNDLRPMPQVFAGNLASSGLNRFIFSVYSHRAAVHESITRFGTHAPTLAAIRTAVATGLSVEVHFVAMQRNFRDLAGVVSLAQLVGAEKVSVLRFVPQGRGKNIAVAEDLSDDDLRQLRDAILELRRKYPRVAIRAGSPFNILAVGHTPCNAAQDVLVVNHRGEIFPCDAFKNVRYPDSKFGSVLSQSLADVWAQSLFLNHVRTVLAAQRGQTCDACAQARDCQSGCLAQKVIRFGWGEADQPDPNCLMQVVQREPEKPVLVQIANGS